jgi:hypothetical protein
MDKALHANIEITTSAQILNSSEAVEASVLLLRRRTRRAWRITRYERDG